MRAPVTFRNVPVIVLREALYVHFTAMDLYCGAVGVDGVEPPGVGVAPTVVGVDPLPDPDGSIVVAVGSITFISGLDTEDVPATLLPEPTHLMRPGSVGV